MDYKRLYIFVEGKDDKRFFGGIVTPLFEGKYDQVDVLEYAQVQKENVNKFIRNIKEMNADYIFVSDIDNAPCVTARKQYIQSKFKEIDKDRIIVVIREIESWYLAVLDDKSSKSFGIRYSNTTDNVTKEQFNDLIPRKFDSRIDFMQEILKCFNLETGKHRNTSFRYFLDKHNCEV
jgi:hypothetical protein